MYYYMSPNAPIVLFSAVFILSIVIGLVLFFTFLDKKNEYKYTGFVKWLYDFLSFRKLMIDSILKILYLVLACFITLGGIILMIYSFLPGLFLLVAGNVFLRLGYEFMMLLIIICRNTSELNRKLGGNQASSKFVSNPGNSGSGNSSQANVYAAPQTDSRQGQMTSQQPHQNAPQQSQSAPQPSQEVPQQSQTQEPGAKPANQKICSKCGASLPPDAAFCSLCGEKQ